jgi:hypothetical protein
MIEIFYHNSGWVKKGACFERKNLYGQTPRPEGVAVVCQFRELKDLTMA